MKPGCAVVVDPGDDPLAPRVAGELEERGAPVRRIAASELAAAPLVLSGEEAKLAGVPVRALFFGTAPDAPLAAGFTTRDASFCSSEAAASWLAVIGLPNVACVNRLDAELWYTTAEWALWRRRLRDAGVPLAPLAVGDGAAEGATRWLPWAGGVARPPDAATRRCFAAATVSAAGLSRAVRCCGEWVHGEQEPDAVEAADALEEEYGLGLLEVLTNADGVVACSAHPRLDDRAARLAGHRVAEVLLAALHRR